MRFFLILSDLDAANNWCCKKSFWSKLYVSVII
jgi:hypothetical protein